MFLQRRIFQELREVKNPNWYNENAIVISEVEDSREICEFMLRCAIQDGTEAKFKKWLKKHANDCHFAVAKNYMDCYAIAYDGGNKAVYACSVEDPFNEELF